MDHPFPYVGSGIAAARKDMQCWVCFRDAVPKPARKAIERGVPKLLAGYFTWFDRVLVFGHGDDSLQWAIRAAYDHLAGEGDFEADDEMPTDAMWKAFNADLDTWLLAVHATRPVAVFIKPIDEEYSTATDAWHAWTCERIPDQVLPIFDELGAKHREVAGYVASMWRSWALDQTFERQQELVAALTDAARAELRKRKVLFVPEPKPAAPKLPSLDEAERIWRSCSIEPSPRGLRLEDAFELALIERGFDPEHSLTNHLYALATAKRPGDVVTLCRAALASGVEFPTHWYPSLIEALLALDRVADAALEMPHLVGTLESYVSGMLVTAMAYHRAAKEPAIEAMLYHAGRAWFTSFNSEFTKAQAKRFGTKPKDLPKQFADWFVRWCEGSYFHLATQPHLGHFLVWFDSIGKPAFGPWVGRFEAERDRRGVLRRALDETTDAASASALVDQLLPSADAEDAASAFHKIRGHAPAVAYRYLIGAMHNERRCFYRYPRGQRVDAIISAMWLTLNHGGLADKIEEAYAIGRGYRLVNNMSLHFNLACCASRVGQRAEALEHVARSLALDYPNPQQIHDDNDLEPLRGSPDFEQLFVADATRRAPPPKPKPAAKKKPPKTKAKPAKKQRR